MKLLVNDACDEAFVFDEKFRLEWYASQKCSIVARDILRDEVSSRFKVTCALPRSDFVVPAAAKVFLTEISHLEYFSIDWKIVDGA